MQLLLQALRRLMGGDSMHYVTLLVHLSTITGAASAVLECMAGCASDFADAARMTMLVSVRCSIR